MNRRPNHFESFDSISSALVGFTILARSNGFKVGTRECQDVLKASELGILTKQQDFYVVLKAIYCQSKEELVTFDYLFDQFWKPGKMAISQKITKRGQTNILKKTESTLVLMGWGDQDEEESNEAKNVSGANTTEKLRYTDFAKVAQHDHKLLEELAYQLWKQMSFRLKKKYKYSNRKGSIDIRKTIRKNLNNGGSFLDLMRRFKQPKKNKLVMLLDVSGSMDKYSFFLLRFIWALKLNFKKVEVFLFSTKLIRATDYLNHHHLEETLSNLSSHIDHWSGGTKIGACLQAFNTNYAKQVLSGRSMTIMLSDGLDTGDPEILSNALVTIKKRTRQLIWLNPLKGMSGYEPIARGMKAAMPYVDDFRSAHNLNSLLSLEKVLANV